MPPNHNPNKADLFGLQKAFMGNGVDSISSGVDSSGNCIKIAQNEHFIFFV